MRLDSFLQLQTKRLKSSFSGDAPRTVRQLVAHRLQLDHSHLFTHPSRILTPEQCAQIDADISQLAAGIPSAYVFGEVPFLDWDFFCDSRALIPRPETEALADELRKTLPRAPLSILDLCCGSGVLGISLALHFTQATLVLTDICGDALALAEKNLERHHLGLRANCYQGDLWEAIPSNQTFDLIIANPPYIAADEVVEDQVLRHEPHVALFSEEEGTLHIRRILSQLDSYLNPGGWAAFELGHTHHHLLFSRTSFPLCEGLFHWRKDPFGVPRYLFYDGPAQKPSGSMP